MKAIKTLAIMAAAVTLAASAQAQELKTAHFLDNYLYGYRLNPSVTPTGTAGFFGIGVGNVSLNPETNFGLSDFLFPLSDGRLVTGLNSAIPASQFPGGLEEINRADLRLTENILAIGSTGKKGGYGHFEINVVADFGLGIPRSFFEAFKNQNSTGKYLVEDINLNGKAYLELAYGRSKRKNNLAIGWTVKGLVGLAKVGAGIDMEIQTAGDDMWVRSQGTLQAAAAPLSIPTDANGNYDFGHVGFNLKNLRPAGYGAAVDLGLSYYLWKDRIILGAAIRDLGGMKWNTDLYGSNSGNKVYVDINNTDGLTDQIKDMINFKPASGSANDSFAMLPFSYNLSAKFKPFNFVTLGVIGTVNKYDSYSSKEIRLGAALTPIRQFNVAGSYTIGDQGNQVGVAASVRLLGINIYAGVDAIQMRFTPKYIPVDKIATTANVGVAIAFGKSSAKAAKEKAKSKEKKKAEEQQEEALPSPEEAD